MASGVVGAAASDTGDWLPQRQVRERRGPRPSLPRIDIAAQSAEDFVLLTDLLLQLRFRPLTLELLGLGPGRTALNLDSSPQ